MRVLLTGGLGCIGSWIVRNLLDGDHDIGIFDLREDWRRLRLLVDDNERSRVRFFAGDVTDLAQVRSAIEGFGATHVIHLAGLQVAVCRNDPLKGAQVNVLGTLAVFEAVRLAGDAIKRLVYASSAAVFGPQECYEDTGRPLPNDATLMPATQYGVFKLCNEHNARIYFQDHKLSSVGLRPWAVYGVGRDFGMTSEPTKAIKSVALGRPYAITFGGRLDFQFADDVAKAFIRSATGQFSGAKSYNLRGVVADVAEFHRALVAVAPDSARLVTYGNRPLGIAPNLDDADWQKDFGPQPATALEDGIRRTYERFRELDAEGRLDTADLD